MTFIHSLKSTATILTGSIVLSLSMNSSVLAVSQYTIIDLGFLSSTDFYNDANGINNAGQVAGISTNNDFFNNITRAFLWSSSTGIVDLGTLDGKDSSYAFNIGEAGQVVGQSYNYSASVFGPENVRPFLWSSGTGMVDLGSLGGSYGTALDVNSAGQVVGVSTDSNDNARPFLWSSDTGIVDLGTFDGRTDSGAIAINDAGQIVVNAGTNNNDSRAFLRNSSTDIIDIGTIFGGTSSAYAMNNLGQVVGTSDDRPFLWSSNTGMIDLGGFGTATGINDLGQVVGSISGDSFYPFLWDSSTGLVDLNTLIDPNSGWRLGGVSDINNNGQIVGTGYNLNINNGQQRAFLLTPTAIPTPALLPGLLMFGARVLQARRQRQAAEVDPS